MYITRTENVHVELSGKKEDHDINHERKTQKFPKVSYCRSKCDPGGMCFDIFWEISFKTNSALHKLGTVCICIFLLAVVHIESLFHKKKEHFNWWALLIMFTPLTARKKTYKIVFVVTHPRKKQIWEYARFYFQFHKVGKVSICYI